MTTAKYFSGIEQIHQWDTMKNAAFVAMFPNVRGVRFDGFQKLVGKVNGEMQPVTRVIFYKANPSLHKCDARCTNAKGRNCECSCGGKYHGSNS